MVDNDLVLSKRLLGLRGRLGLTQNAMAEMLYVSITTYRNWEMGSKPRSENRDRLYRFLDNAEAQLTILADHGIDITGLVPLNLAASHIGMPHEVLLNVYRNGKFPAEDLGILGLWVSRDQMSLIAEAVKH